MRSRDAWLLRNPEKGRGVKFHSTVELGGKTATGIEVPGEVVAALGSNKRPAVTVTINGYSYRSTIGSMGGRFLLPLSAEHRSKAGVAAGDQVDVDVELDSAPREVVVPADFASALDEAAAAKAAFSRLAYSHQLRHVLAIEGAKSPETRARRIASAIQQLTAGSA